MAPESQTLFSITLFLALSSLLAWSNRHTRRGRTMIATVTAPPAQLEESVVL